MSLQSTIRTSHTTTQDFEPYVSAEKAAAYLDVAPKTLLEKARKGELPAYPWGSGVRKTWRFKISQLDEWMKGKLHSERRPPLSERKGYQ
jgi:excisionase family DNA binding protein